MLKELGRQNEGRKGRTWHYDYHDEEHSDDRPSHVRSAADQGAVLNALEREGAIKLLKTEKRYGFVSMGSGSVLGKVPGSVTLEVLNPAFERLYAEYVGKPFKQQRQKIAIIISGKRGISRADGKGASYPVSKKRKALVLALLEGPMHAEEIIDVIKYENMTTVSHQVDAINALANKNLEFGGLELISRNESSGYFYDDKTFDVKRDE